MGLRAAVIELGRPGSPFRFVLFPMVHVGDPAFYQAVSRRLRDCDMVVMEGIRGRSRSVSSITRAYHAAKLGRLGLVVQDLDLASLDVPIVYPDMDGREFSQGVRALPLRQRLTWWCLAPVLVPTVLLFGTRAVLASHLTLDDDHGVSARSEGFEEWEALAVDRRDALLIEELARIHEAHGTAPLRVAVVYGAQHMIAVVHTLSARFGYSPRSATWLTVFDY
ncbi:hypothetical protein SAMN04489712_110118 [Thermomonospora echinospora]|uniref:Uncharacterized protein n=2 Tax=Thermomonospora echinospora TaxID=1992 RepID=A0A1H6CM31_9ACTN|nr:hypothetical protein SAMN04489712_110118 [Thermomonospora echinospora]